MAQSAVNGDLAPLHRLLRRIGRKRRWLRLTIGVLGIVAGLAFVTLALFALDWALHLTVPQRVILLVLVATFAILASRRFILPWFTGPESELELALLVQKHFGIDSDLVAALQFERPEAAQWGSVELEKTVIRQVATRAKELPLIEDVPRAPLRKRVVATVCGLALFAALVFLFPEHVSIFAKRLFLHDLNYPTATQIVRVIVNDQPIAWDKAQQRIWCGAGSTLSMTVVVSGKMPREGQVVFRTAQPRRELRVPLIALDRQADRASLPSQRVFSGKLMGIDRPCQLRMTLGDATSQWIEVAVVPPPVVLPWFVYQEVPSGNPEPKILFGKTQISVREGTQVLMGVVSQSELKPVVASIGPLEIPLQKGLPKAIEGRYSEFVMNRPVVAKGTSEDSAQQAGVIPDIWWLDPAGTPLEKVAYPVRIRFKVRNRFELEPASPVEVFVAVRPDYPPQVEARTITRLVLPAAQPSLFVTARDDVGLRELRVVGKVIRTDGEEGNTCQWILWQAKGQSVPALSEKYKVDLGQLKAKKGDKIELVVMAEDERGANQSGVVTQTDAVLMEVTDLAGILAVMADADRESAAQLQEMIDRQLDVGGGQ